LSQEHITGTTDAGTRNGRNNISITQQPTHDEFGAQPRRVPRQDGVHANCTRGVNVHAPVIDEQASLRFAW
jgi:hypothetical protein